MKRLNNFTLDCVTQIYSRPDMPGTTHNDVYAALLELKEYRSVCPTPGKLAEIDEMYLKKCEEVNRLKKQLENRGTGDLISREALLADIRKYVLGTPLQEMFETIVDNQHTAYDVDKVLRKIANHMFIADLYGDDWDGQTVNNLLCFGDVTDIVRGGGVDEN